MRNCSCCTRWRPLADYGAAESHAPTVCVACRRDDQQPRPSRTTRPHLFDDHRYQVRNRRRVERGSHVWTREVSDWLREKADEHGWEQLALWAECGERTLRRAERLEAHIIDVGIIDRLVIAEGTTSLAELCPA